MCVIVDMSVAKRVLLDENDKDYDNLQEAIFSKNRIPSVIIIYGGKLTDEYIKAHNVYQIVLSLERAGKAHQKNYQAVSKETKLIKRNLSYKSDDEHILALARISGTRILASADNDLKSDFKDKNLISKPRGKIYGSPTHGSLLDKLCK